jgi:hypothetical protein
MKTITLTPEEYITFCLIMQQEEFGKPEIDTTFIKSGVKITGSTEFLESIGY